MDQVTLNKLVEKTKNNIIKAEGSFPNEFTTAGEYKYGENRSWTEGFWIGIIWCCYELTEDEFFLDSAISYTDLMCERVNNHYRVDHHDLGFLIGLSVVPAYEYTCEEKYLHVIEKTADILVSRFNPIGNYIQAWGKMNDETENRFIIDSLLNIPFLFKASELLNNENYSNIAKIHYDTVLKYAVRDDYSSFHTVFMDKINGKFIKGETNQGNSDDSCWSRGQAWLISGMIYNHKYGTPLNQNLFIEACKLVYDNIPGDNVLYWDFDFSDNNPSHRDAASNAIILTALEDIDYKSNQLLVDLHEKLEFGITKCINENIDEQQLLDLCTYNIPQKKGIDSGNIWGDYFLMDFYTKKVKDSYKGRF